MEIKYNKQGEIVSGIPSLRKKEYGTGYYDKHGWPIPDWDSWIINQDENGWGFDTTKKHEKKGNYLEEVVLRKGTRLIRYGPSSGRYTAPLGTRFEKLSLPWVEDECEYHEYIVIADTIKVLKCTVHRGFAAPGFEFPGQGVQYLHIKNIKDSIDLELIKEVTRRNVIRRRHGCKK